jgi:transposase-like protein
MDDELTHLECGRCGNIHDVQKIDLIEAVRWLCKECRTKVLEWI